MRIFKNRSAGNRIQSYILLPLILALVAIVAAACADGVGPQAGISRDYVPQLNTADGSQTQSETGAVFEILRQSSSAPALDAYEVSFWAVKGKSAKAQVFYLAPDRAHENQLFATFSVPKRGLWLGPSGAPIARGDSVLITINIDPVDFRFDFEPAGLMFNEAAPATLDVWYGLAENAPRREPLDVWYMHDSNPIYPTISKQIKKKKKIIANVDHFSGYAVAW